MYRLAIFVVFAGILLVGPSASRSVDELAPQGDLPITSVAASSTAWPISNAYDGDVASSWSSTTFTTATHTEWIAWWFGRIAQVNYVKVRPRYGQHALGFPITFTISGYDGTQWQPLAPHIAFPTPQRDDWIILRLPTTVRMGGIQIVATELGRDNVNNYVLQFAEVGAGYDVGFEQFQLLSNNGIPAQSEIRNVGSTAFNPARLTNWHYDQRAPLMTAQPGGNPNIYAPSIVRNGLTWNIYFGGWDGTPDGHDRISLVTTQDFLSFSSHFSMIDSGVYSHINNESVIKIDNFHWRMYYTTAENMYGTNKPGVSTSVDGVNWNPRVGTPASLIIMHGFSDWDHANINGGNVISYRDGLYYLYFTDFRSLTIVHYATSQDGVTFNYQGIALTSNETRIINDFKEFAYNNRPYYIAGLHANGPLIYIAHGEQPTQFSQMRPLFQYHDTRDRYITSVGFVSDGTRLFGALYGAGAVTSLDRNAIWAVWLQKKVIFANDYVRWGDDELAYGPNRIILPLTSQVETGRFFVYDTDGTTLLYTSPRVTMRAGDIWRYLPRMTYLALIQSR